MAPVLTITFSPMKAFALIAAPSRTILPTPIFANGDTAAQLETVEFLTALLITRFSYSFCLKAEVPLIIPTVTINSAFGCSIINWGISSSQPITGNPKISPSI